MAYSNANIKKRNVTEIVRTAVYQPINNLLKNNKEDKMERDIRNMLLSHITEVGIQFDIKE